ncbi:hypothetical protein CAAN3_07S02058 [[Candida] anglica]
MSTHYPTFGRSSGLGSVFKSFTKSLRASGPSTSGSSSSQARGSAAAPPISVNPKVVGGGADQQALFAQLQSGPVASRANAARKMAQSLDRYAISSVPEIWYAARDLCDPRVSGGSRAVRRAAVELLLRCIEQDKAISTSVRLVYFEDIARNVVSSSSSSSNNTGAGAGTGAGTGASTGGTGSGSGPVVRSSRTGQLLDPDLDLFLMALKELTNDGRDVYDLIVYHHERNLVSVLEDLLVDSIDSVRAGGASASAQTSASARSGSAGAIATSEPTLGAFGMGATVSSLAALSTIASGSTTVSGPTTTAPTTTYGGESVQSIHSSSGATTQAPAPASGPGSGSVSVPAAPTTVIPPIVTLLQFTRNCLKFNFSLLEDQTVASLLHKVCQLGHQWTSSMEGDQSDFHINAGCVEVIDAVVRFGQIPSGVVFQDVVELLCWSHETVPAVRSAVWDVVIALDSVYLVTSALVEVMRKGPDVDVATCLGSVHLVEKVLEREPQSEVDCVFGDVMRGMKSCLEAWRGEEAVNLGVLQYWVRVFQAATATATATATPVAGAGVSRPSQASTLSPESAIASPAIAGSAIAGSAGSVSFIFLSSPTLSIYHILSTISIQSPATTDLWKQLCTSLQTLYQDHTLQSPRQPLIDLLLLHPTLLSPGNIAFILAHYSEDHLCVSTCPHSQQNCYDLLANFYYPAIDPTARINTLDLLHRATLLSLSLASTKTLAILTEVFHKSFMETTHQVVDHLCGILSSLYAQVPEFESDFHRLGESFLSLLEGNSTSRNNSSASTTSSVSPYFSVKFAEAMCTCFVTRPTVQGYRSIISLSQWAMKQQQQKQSEEVGSLQQELLLTTFRCLVRLRATYNGSLYFSQVRDMDGLATAFGRNVNDSSYVSPLPEGSSSSSNSSSRNYWTYPESPDYLPMEHFDKPSAQVTTISVDLSLWLDILLDVFLSYVSWEVYTFCWAHFCPQLANMALFERHPSQILRFREIACEQLTLNLPANISLPRAVGNGRRSVGNGRGRADSRSTASNAAGGASVKSSGFKAGGVKSGNSGNSGSVGGASSAAHAASIASAASTTPTEITRADIQVAIVRTFSALLGYHELFSKQDEDQLVNALIFGLGSWEKTAIPCIHILTICCYEIPLSIKKFLLVILTKLQTRISSPFASSPTLEFLMSLINLETLTANFTLDEFRRVFAIAFKYIQQANERVESSQQQQQQPTGGSRPVQSDQSHLQTHGLDATVDQTPSTTHQSTNTTHQSTSTSQYVNSMAYSVISAWYLKLELPERRQLSSFLVRNLLSSSSDPEKDDQTMAYVDLVMRFTYSDLDLVITPPARRQNSINSSSWIIGVTILQISTDPDTKVSEMIIRRPTGVTTMRISLGDPNLSESSLTFSAGTTSGAGSGAAAGATGATTSPATSVSSTPTPGTPSASSTGLGVTPTTSSALPPRFTPSHLLLQLFNSIDPLNRSKPLPLIEDQATLRAVSTFDRIPTVEFHKVGLIYVAPGQRSETEILRNQVGSPAYHDLLQHLGQLVPLHGCREVYVGGLDVENNTDGDYALFWKNKTTQLIFHTTTMMPNNDNDKHSDCKKRHIGNNYVNVFFDESGEEFNFNVIKSQFNFLNIVVTPTATGGGGVLGGALPGSNTGSYKVKVYRRAGVPAVFATCHFKIISQQQLPQFIRNLAILANQFASVWHTPGEHTSNWAHRLRQIKVLREKTIHTHATLREENDKLSHEQSNHGATGTTAQSFLDQLRQVHPATSHVSIDSAKYEYVDKDETDLYSALEFNSYT